MVRDRKQYLRGQTIIESMTMASSQIFSSFRCLSRGSVSSGDLEADHLQQYSLFALLTTEVFMRQTAKVFYFGLMSFLLCGASAFASNFGADTGSHSGGGSYHAKTRQRVEALSKIHFGSMQAIAQLIEPSPEKWNKDHWNVNYDARDALRTVVENFRGELQTPSEQQSLPVWDLIQQEYAIPYMLPAGKVHIDQHYLPVDRTNSVKFRHPEGVTAIYHWISDHHYDKSGIAHLMYHDFFNYLGGKIGVIATFPEYGGISRVNVDYLLDSSAAEDGPSRVHGKILVQNVDQTTSDSDRSIGMVLRFVYPEYTMHVNVSSQLNWADEERNSPAPYSFGVTNNIQNTSVAIPWKGDSFDVPFNL